MENEVKYWRGLAAAFAAQQAGPLAALNVQIDRVKPRESAVTERRVLHADQSHPSFLFMVPAAPVGFRARTPAGPDEAMPGKSRITQPKARS